MWNPYKNITPVTRRRLNNFKKNRRAFLSLRIFLLLFLISLFSELLINDKPVIAYYKGEILMPIIIDYPEEKFGGFLAVTDYRDPFISDEIEANGWILWPLVRYNYQTINYEIPSPAPSPPSFLIEREMRCQNYPGGIDDKNCNIWNWNWLGTDDQGRDVLARLVYGFRISVIFGLILTVLSSCIGIIVGALQGFFGGLTDLFSQRLIEIWNSIPSLYLLIIISAVITPSFWLLLLILLLFSWVSLVGVVRAEFLRARNFEYVLAAKALGVSNIKIMFKHLLPNAMVATLTFLPFILNGSIVTLTSLDFLGFGLPPGSASLGELLSQGKNNIHAPWLGLTSFFGIAVLLSLLIFIGEGVRDAFDPRNVFID